MNTVKPITNCCKGLRIFAVGFGLLSAYTYFRAEINHTKNDVLVKHKPSDSFFFIKDPVVWKL